MADLVRAEILRPDAPLGFVHPLVRDAVYHELPAAERALLHAAAAQLLRDAQASDEDVATELLAAPYRGERWVVELLQAAAAGARHKGAADSAVAYLERALAEPVPEDLRTSLLLELGLTETLTSGPAAAAHLREAWEAIAEPPARASIAATLARTLLFTAPAQEVAEVTNRALAETPAELIDERQALRHPAHGCLLWCRRARRDDPAQAYRDRGGGPGGEDARRDHVVLPGVDGCER